MGGKLRAHGGLKDLGRWGTPASLSWTISCLLSPSYPSGPLITCPLKILTTNLPGSGTSQVLASKHLSLGLWPFMNCLPPFPCEFLL